MRALGAVLPDDGIVVLESPSRRSRCATSCGSRSPARYYFGAGGGLGFGLAASVGVQLAQPDRPVVCVVGEGSAQYAIQAFWTAAAYDVPVTFLVVRNDEYAILKWFGDAGERHRRAGPRPAARSTASRVAAGYGVPSTRADGRTSLADALSAAIASDGPSLVEVRVAPGMALA